MHGPGSPNELPTTKLLIFKRIRISVELNLRVKSTTITTTCNDGEELNGAIFNCIGVKKMSMGFKKVAC